LVKKIFKNQASRGDKLKSTFFLKTTKKDVPKGTEMYHLCFFETLHKHNSCCVYLK